ncbi:MAG TPA: hypothetical protein VHW66_19040 [Stellaceae bacterium]|jgi:hypothetical protein|nr:hypothetical protein [Stellaceae bacterium]
MRFLGSAIALVTLMVPLCAMADATYQAAVQGLPAAPVEMGTSDQQGHVIPTSPANPMPTSDYGDRQVSVPIVTAAAYASGNDVGGLNAVSFQGSGPPQLVEDFSIASTSGQTPTLTVYLFDSQPQHSTFTDKGSFSLDTTTPGTDGIVDVDRLLLDPFALTLAAPTGTTVSFADAANLTRLPRSGAPALYYALAAGSIFTPGSTSDFRVAIQAVQQHQ